MRIPLATPFPATVVAAVALGRERLCRYLSRPAFALSRLRMRRDGNVSYRVKKASRGRVTERVMTPLETLARLAAIVPPPRYPLLRFHGVLAPRHRWRARVVPQPPSAAPKCNVTARERRGDGEKGARAEGRAVAPPATAGDGRAVFPLQARDAVVTSSLTTTGCAEQLAPNVLSIAHGGAHPRGRALRRERSHRLENAAQANLRHRPPRVRPMRRATRRACPGHRACLHREAPRRPPPPARPTRRSLSPPTPTCAMRRDGLLPLFFDPPQIRTNRRRAR